MYCPNCGKETNQTYTCEHCGGSLILSEKRKTISFNLPTNLMAVMALVISVVVSIVFLIWKHQMSSSVVEDLDGVREIEKWVDLVKGLAVSLEILCPFGLVLGTLGLDKVLKTKKDGMVISIISILICTIVLIVVFNSSSGLMDWILTMISESAL